MSGSGSTYLASFGDGASVLERLLLAIIEAHTTPENEGRQYERLSVAINALTGDVKATVRDEATAKALDWMKRERHRDACDYDMRVLSSGGNDAGQRPRTLQELALLAAHQFLDCSNLVEQHEATKRLFKQFAEQRRADGFHDGTAYDCDLTREAVETDAVKRLCAELAEWDVPTRL